MKVFEKDVDFLISIQEDRAMAECFRFGGISVVETIRQFFKESKRISDIKILYTLLDRIEERIKRKSYDESKRNNQKSKQG